MAPAVDARGAASRSTTAARRTAHTTTGSRLRRPARSRASRACDGPRTTWTAATRPPAREHLDSCSF